MILCKIWGPRPHFSESVSIFWGVYLTGKLWKFPTTMTCGFGDVYGFLRHPGMLRDLVPVVKSKANKNPLFWTTQRNKNRTKKEFFPRWLNQSIWKICSSKWIISPGIRVKIPKIFQPPPSFSKCPGAHHQHQQRPPTWPPNLLCNPLLNKSSPCQLPTTHRHTTPAPIKTHQCGLTT